MKIIFQNLGVVKEAEVDLSKRLNIFCGPNGTGKTYIAYAIYGLTKLLLVVHQLFKFQELLEKKEINLNLDFQKLHVLHKSYLQTLKQEMPVEFATKRKFFNDFEVETTCTLTEFEANLRKAELSYDFEETGINVKVIKRKNSDSMQIQLVKPVALNADIDNFEVYFFAKLSRYLCNYPIISSYFLPVERNSVFTFSKELALKRLKEYGIGDPLNDPGINERQQRYPHAILDSLIVAEDLAFIKSNFTPYASLAEEIEKDILHGSVIISDHGNLQFSPENSKETVLPVHLTASLVKTISGLVIYLKHQAKINDLIIIDEPEINLHPDNQILLSRIFAKLVNNGFRLLISTHSDYIIREINNLIMLSLEQPAVKKLAKTYGYKEDQKLNPNDVSAYLFNFNADNNTRVVVEKLAINEQGFEVKTIDAAIHILNDISEDLFYAVKYPDNE